MAKRAGALTAVVLLAVAWGCGEQPAREPEATEGPPPAVEVGEVPEVEPIPVDIFQREDAGPGKRVLRVLLPPAASPEQIRQAIDRTLREEGERDTSLVAIRAIGYAARPTGPREADLVPVVWAEWLPPEGWAAATPASRERFHRVYTYLGAAPAW